jgi:hypothetical protein
MYRHVESQVSARLQRQSNINKVHQSCAPRQRVRLSDAGEGVDGYGATGTIPGGRVWLPLCKTIGGAGRCAVEEE